MSKKSKPKNWAKKIGDPLWKTRRTFTVDADGSSFVHVDAAKPGRTETDIVAAVEREWFVDDARRELGAGADVQAVTALARRLAVAQAVEIVSALSLLEGQRARQAAARARKVKP